MEHKDSADSMSETAPSLDALQEAPHAAWLFDVRRRRISWGNKPALAFWREETLLDLIEHDFDPADPMVLLFESLARAGEEGARLHHVTLDLLDGPARAALTCRLVHLDEDQPGVLAELTEENAALSDRFSRFGEMVENAPLPLSLFTPGGALLYQNKEAERLMQARAAESGLAGLLGDVPLAGALLDKAQRTGTASRLVQLSGMTPRLTCRLTLRKIHDPETETPALVALWRDAGGRKTALSEAAGEAGELQALIGTVSDFTWRMSRQGGALRITELSDSFEKVTGTPAASLFGLTLEEAAAHHGVTLTSELLEALAGGAPWRDIALSWPRADGGTITLLVSAVPRRGRDGRLKGWTGIGRAGGTQQSGTAQAPSSGIALFDTLDLPVLSLGADGHVTGANASARALFNLPLPGTPAERLFGPYEASAIRKEIAGKTASPPLPPRETGLSVTVPAGHTRAGGEKRFHLFIMAWPHEKDTGRLLCFLLNAADTDLHKAEAMRRTLKDAERALKRKSDVTANIAHELRTPLNAILGFSEIMRDARFGPLGNEKYTGYVENIHKSGQHLLSLINDFLDLSKIEAGGFTPDFEQVDLAPLLSECTDLMSQSAAAQQVSLRLEKDENLPPLVADRRSLRQILLNLLSNAIKFTPEGGEVVLSAHADKEGALTLRVRDNGAGMDAEELAKALEPYGQGRSGQKRGGGTGLGLPLTRALCEANHAAFSIHSEPGKGTGVTITFPSTQVLAG